MEVLQREVAYRNVQKRITNLQEEHEPIWKAGNAEIKKKMFKVLLM